MSKPYTAVEELPITTAPAEYRTYPQRWVLLATIFLLNVGSSLLWITYSSVSGYAAGYFHQSLFAINHLSTVYYAMYIVFSLTASWVIHEKGLIQGVIMVINGSWRQGLC
jgi:FLVCR family MFS transporter 7